jgi:putative endonuclease
MQLGMRYLLEDIEACAELVEGWERLFEMERFMAFWVYLLLCADGSYYTGHTDRLEKRIADHQAGEVPGYTSTRRPVELVFVQAFPTREEALTAELQIKGWSRKKKEAMIPRDWKEVQRLSWGTRNPLPDHLK